MNAAPAPQFDNPAQQAQAATLGMWVFLATELMLFGPLFLAYVYSRYHFPRGFVQASRLTEVALGSTNTALLLSSSLAMALAVVARNGGALTLARRLLWLAAACGAGFLAIKGVEYEREWHEHLWPGAGFGAGHTLAEGARLFFFLYFCMTGLHALHLALGTLAAAGFALDLRRQAAQHLALLGLYWHFVDMVWLFLYPILYLVGRSGGG